MAGANKKGKAAENTVDKSGRPEIVNCLQSAVIYITINWIVCIIAQKEVYTSDRGEYG